MSTAYLEITLQIAPENRPAAAAVYTKFKRPFLETVGGALTKELLLRSDDVQVLHGFTAKADAEAYLESKIFAEDVVTSLKPYLAAAPEVRIYETFASRQRATPPKRPAGLSKHARRTSGPVSQRETTINEEHENEPAPNPL